MRLFVLLMLIPSALFASDVSQEVGSFITRAPENLLWSVETLVGAFLGWLLHVSTSWQEWKAITANKGMTFAAYLTDDKSGFVSSTILTVIAYFGLPVLGQIAWVQQALGYAPGMNFLSAALVSYLTSSMGYKGLAVLKAKLGW